MHQIAERKVTFWARWLILLNILHKKGKHPLLHVVTAEENSVKNHPRQLVDRCCCLVGSFLVGVNRNLSKLFFFSILFKWGLFVREIPLKITNKSLNLLYIYISIFYAIGAKLQVYNKIYKTIKLRITILCPKVKVCMLFQRFLFTVMAGRNRTPYLFIKSNISWDKNLSDLNILSVLPQLLYMLLHRSRLVLR